MDLQREDGNGIGDHLLPAALGPGHFILAPGHAVEVQGGPGEEAVCVLSSVAGIYLQM